ncbi:hypothetical protein DL96DRAFT_1625106 [Flagelloscypha sp. PMI_526]|nr:hypothetical protein DL96DRAFT_1625106 [Flagelloscypha sp. PMI_526]
MQVFQSLFQSGFAPKRTAHGPPQTLIPVISSRTPPSHKSLVNFPDSFPLDVFQLICEIAALYDRETSAQLNLSCRMMHSWITPIRFHIMSVRTFEQAERLQLLERPDHVHISNAVREFLLDEYAWSSHWNTAVPFDFQKIISYFPNLTALTCSHTRRICAPLAPLPSNINTLHVIDVKPSDEEKTLISNAALSAQITHLFIPPHYPLTDFCTLTHLWVSIGFDYPTSGLQNSDVAFVSYLLSLPPVKTLPSSIKTCILHSRAEIDLSYPLIPQLVDIIMGSVDSRIVLAFGVPKRTWDYTGLIGKYVLKDAVMFWEGYRVPNYHVWQEANSVMARRSDYDFRERVGKLERRPTS